MQNVISPEEVSNFVASMRGSVPRNIFSTDDNIHTCTCETLLGKCGGVLLHIHTYHFKCARCGSEHVSKAKAQLFIVAQSVLNTSATFRRHVRWGNVRAKKYSNIAREYGGRVC